MEDFEKKNDGSLDDRVSEQSQETGKSPKGKKK